MEPPEKGFGWNWNMIGLQDTAILGSYLFYIKLDDQKCDVIMSTKL